MAAAVTVAIEKPVIVPLKRPIDLGYEHRDQSPKRVRRSPPPAAPARTLTSTPPVDPGRGTGIVLNGARRQLDVGTGAAGALLKDVGSPSPLPPPATATAKRPLDGSSGPGALMGPASTSALPGTAAPPSILASKAAPSVETNVPSTPAPSAAPSSAPPLITPQNDTIVLTPSTEEIPAPAVVFKQPKIAAEIWARIRSNHDTARSPDVLPGAAPATKLANLPAKPSLSSRPVTTKVTPKAPAQLAKRPTVARPSVLTPVPTPSPQPIKTTSKPVKTSTTAASASARPTKKTATATKNVVTSAPFSTPQAAKTSAKPVKASTAAAAPSSSSRPTKPLTASAKAAITSVKTTSAGVKARSTVQQGARKNPIPQGGFLLPPKPPSAPSPFTGTHLVPAGTSEFNPLPGPPVSDAPASQPKPRGESRTPTSQSNATKAASRAEPRPNGFASYSSSFRPPGNDTGSSIDDTSPTATVGTNAVILGNRTSPTLSPTPLTARPNFSVTSATPFAREARRRLLKSSLDTGLSPYMTAKGLRTLSDPTRPRAVVQAPFAAPTFGEATQNAIGDWDWRRIKASYYLSLQDRAEVETLVLERDGELQDLKLKMWEREMGLERLKRDLSSRDKKQLADHRRHLVEHRRWQVKLERLQANLANRDQDIADSRRWSVEQRERGDRLEEEISRRSRDVGVVLQDKNDALKRLQIKVEEVKTADAALAEEKQRHVNQAAAWSVERSRLCGDILEIKESNAKQVDDALVKTTRLTAEVEDLKRMKTEEHQRQVNRCQAWEAERVTLVAQYEDLQRRKSVIVGNLRIAQTAPACVLEDEREVAMIPSQGT